MCKISPISFTYFSSKRTHKKFRTYKIRFSRIRRSSRRKILQRGLFLDRPNVPQTICRKSLQMWSHCQYLPYHRKQALLRKHRWCQSSALLKRQSHLLEQRPQGLHSWRRTRSDQARRGFHRSRLSARLTGRYSSLWRFRVQDRASLSRVGDQVLCDLWTWDQRGDSEPWRRWVCDSSVRRAVRPSDEPRSGDACAEQADGVQLIRARPLVSSLWGSWGDHWVGHRCW